MRARSAGLDGLRGVAALVVLTYHAIECAHGWHQAPVLRGGWIGVQVFFALSGWVIAGCVDADDYALRRTRRLLPTAALVAVATCALAWRWDWLLNVPASPWHPHSSGFLGPYWSLVVEVLWYVVAPWWVRQIRRDPAMSGLALLGLWAAASVLRAGVPYENAYNAAQWHAPIIMGAAWLRVAGGAAWPVARRMAPLAAVGLGGLIWQGGDVRDLGPVLDLLCWVLIAGVATGALTGLGKLRRLGERSFVLYVVHVPVLGLVPGPLWLRIACVVLTTEFLWLTFDRHFAGSARVGRSAMVRA